VYLFLEKVLMLLYPQPYFSHTHSNFLPPAPSPVTLSFIFRLPPFPTRFRVIAGETWVDSLEITTEEGGLNMPASPPRKALAQDCSLSLAHFRALPSPSPSAGPRSPSPTHLPWPSLSLFRQRYPSFPLHPSPSTPPSNPPFPSPMGHSLAYSQYLG
jgi:hypothetical protein